MSPVLLGRRRAGLEFVGARVVGVCVAARGHAAEVEPQLVADTDGDAGAVAAGVPLAAVAVRQVDRAALDAVVVAAVARDRQRLVGMLVAVEVEGVVVEHQQPVLAPQHGVVDLLLPRALGGVGVDGDGPGRPRRHRRQQRVGALAQPAHVLPAQQVVADRLHGRTAFPRPGRPGGVHRDGGDIAVAQRIPKDVVDVVIVAQHRVGYQRRPGEPVGGGGDLEATILPPAKDVASRRIGTVPALIDHTVAELDGGRVVEDAHRADPVDTVVRLHVPQVRDGLVARVGPGAEPGAEAPALGVAQHGYVGLEVAVLGAGDDRVGDGRVALGAIDPAREPGAGFDQEVVHEQMRSALQAQRLVARAGLLARPVDARPDGLVTGGD